MKSDKEEWISQCEELKNCDLIVFENVDCNKSVKLIPHLQILARKTMSEIPKIVFINKVNSNKKLFIRLIVLIIFIVLCSFLFRFIYIQS